MNYLKIAFSTKTSFTWNMNDMQLVDFVQEKHDWEKLKKPG